MVNKKAIKLINNEEYEKANQLSFILFQKKNMKEFLEINNLLLEKNYIPALPLRGYYHLIEDAYHDNNDYGEKYFNKYLEERQTQHPFVFKKLLHHLQKEMKKNPNKLLTILLRIIMKVHTVMN